MNNRIIAGLCGTAISGIGASLSISEIQSIVSIAITILGFVISVLIPLGIKLYKQIKKAKEDGVITKEEMVEIIDTTKEIANKSESFIKEVSDKTEGDKKEC